MKDFIIDSFYAGYGFTLMYLYRKPPKKYLNYVKEKKNPVLVLQGVFNRWGFMKKTADDLSSLGYPVYVFPQLGNNTLKISEAAKLIAEFIDIKDLRNVVIVGHSKGGLIGKYIMANLDDKKRIKGLVSIASPFHGSYSANRFRLLKANEFEPNHETIIGLESQKSINHNIITISASFDNVVKHEKGGTLEGARKNIHVKAAGHHKIVFDRETRIEVIRAVEELSN